MAGSFTSKKYATDNGDVVNIRVQATTIACVIDGVTNAESGDPLSDGFPSAKVSGGRREIGINARTVTLTLTAAKVGYTEGKPLTIPALTEAFYIKCTSGKTGTYLGVACKVIGRSAEVIK